VRKLFLILSLAALSISACGESSASTPQPAATIGTIPSRPTPTTQELEPTNPKKDIEVTSGDEFTITVNTFVDPNYHWEVVEALDANIIEYVWKDHVPDNPNTANSSGRDVWRFKAIAPGKTTIKLGYYLGTEDKASPEVVFTIVVK